MGHLRDVDAESWLRRCVELIVGVGDRMVTPEFSKALVEGVRNDVMIMRGGLEDTKEKGLELQARTHATELEVAQPQLLLGETGIAAILVEQISDRFSHVRFPPIQMKFRFRTSTKK